MLMSDVERDPDGYLKNLNDWDEALAETIAHDEGLTLTPSHWEVILFLRDYYKEYHATPPMRLLVQAIKKSLGEEKGNSRYLFGLFPEGPGKQATKIAGLPKPPWCL